jgi:K+-transporting ATPase KdpF subunit
MSGCECKRDNAQPSIDEVNHVGSLLRRCRDCVLYSDVGLHESLRTALRRIEMEYAIAGVTTIFLFIYLMYALLRPERF